MGNKLVKCYLVLHLNEILDHCWWKHIDPAVRFYWMLFPWQYVKFLSKSHLDEKTQTFITIDKVFNRDIYNGLEGITFIGTDCCIHRYASWVLLLFLSLGDTSFDTVNRCKINGLIIGFPNFFQGFGEWNSDVISNGCKVRPFIRSLWLQHQLDQ